MGLLIPGSLSLGPVGVGGSALDTFTPCAIAPAYFKEGGANAASTSTMYRYPLEIVRDCVDLSLVFAGQGTSSGVIQTVRAALEVNGVIYPAFFRGARDVALWPGGFAASDPVPVRVSAGTTVWSRHYVQSTGTWNETVVNFASGKSVGGSDVTLSGSNPPAATGVYVYPPSALLARSPGAGKGAAVIGDSIAAGFGDGGTTPTAATSGFFGRAANAAGWGAVRAAHTGQFASTVAGGGEPALLALAGCSKKVAVLMGTNDLTSSSPTFNQLTGYLSTIYKVLKGRGQQVWGVTIPPRTTSTDGWATTGNQTVSGANYTGGAGSLRSQVNAWIRAGGGGDLQGYWDLADAVESARDSGLWKPVDYTADGTHPATTGSAAGAAAVPAGLFA